LLRASDAFEGVVLPATRFVRSQIKRKFGLA
jgi:hypothetical protein